MPLTIYAMAALPIHWQYIVRPETSDQVSEFFRRLTVMHTMRSHAHDKIPDEPPLPRNWRSWVHKVQTEKELNSLRHNVKRGLPFGDDKMIIGPETAPFA